MDRLIDKQIKYMRFIWCLINVVYKIYYFDVLIVEDMIYNYDVYIVFYCILYLFILVLIYVVCVFQDKFLSIVLRFGEYFYSKIIFKFGLIFQ